jgi:tetratricopeptide (TPR) repeat protein
LNVSQVHYSRLRTLARAAILTLACLVSAHAEDKWIRLTSAHFEMFTPCGEKQAREALAHFEQARSFFLQASVSKSVSNFPVRIVAFRGPKGYQPYRFNSGAVAFYLGTESRDFIVMQDLEPDHYPVAVHEYTHLIVRHTGMNLPLWLNEGLADLYSTLEPHGDYVLVGRPLEGRVVALNGAKWLDLPALFAIGQDSPYYNEREKMSIFYSESWLLADMLMRSPAYAPKFNAFLLATARGRATADALHDAFGKDLAAVSADMREYFRVNMLGATTMVTKFPIKLDKSAEQPEVSPAPDMDLRITLVDLLVGEQKVTEATHALVDLASQYPQSPLVDEAWADMAWRQNKIPDMVTHCQNAFRLGSRNPKFLDQCAVAAMNQGVPVADVIPMLDRSLESDPNNKDAHFHLAVLYFNQQKFGAALSHLSQVHSVSDTEASRFYLMQGFAKFRLGSEEDARKDLEMARKLAKTPVDAAEASRVLGDLERASAEPAEPPQDAEPAQEAQPAREKDDPSESRPTLKRTRPPGEAHEAAQSQLPAMKLPRFDGLLTRIDCPGTTWHVHVSASTGERVFLVTGPKDIQIRNASGEDMFRFVCGENLDRRVSVYYDPRSNDPELAGVAKLLDFSPAQ